MKLIESCEAYFHTRNLYDVLLVPKTASDTELKKAYKKVSLKVHPDRVDENEKETATRKFQTLAKVFFILSDKEKRAVYDQTGEVDDESAIPEDRDWESYFRFIFPKITEEAIIDFLTKYKGSAEELEDLKSIYIKCEGDMDKMAEWLIGYDVAEEARYCDILNDLISKKEVPNFRNFTAESMEKKKARQKRFEKEAKRAAKAKKARGIQDKSTESLQMAIEKRNRDREQTFDALLKNLEEKYAKKKRKTK